MTTPRDLSRLAWARRCYETQPVQLMTLRLGVAPTIVSRGEREGHMPARIHPRTARRLDPARSSHVFSRMPDHARSSLGSCSQPTIERFREVLLSSPLGHAETVDGVTHLAGSASGREPFRLPLHAR